MYEKQFKANASYNIDRERNETYTGHHENWLWKSIKFDATAAFSRTNAQRLQERKERKKFNERNEFSGDIEAKHKNKLAYSFRDMVIYLFACTDVHKVQKYINDWESSRLKNRHRMCDFFGQQITWTLPNMRVALLWLLLLLLSMALDFKLLRLHCNVLLSHDFNIENGSNRFTSNDRTVVLDCCD